LNPHAAEDAVSIALAAEAKIVVGLEAEPGFRGYLEIGSEAQGGVRGNAPGFVYYRADAVGRDIEVTDELIDADAERLH
jgi:hypothetical protein